MSDLTSGSYTLNGFPGFVTTATVAPAQTVALTLAGAQGSFDITSLSQAITTITQTVAYSDDLVLSSVGGEIAVDSTIGANADVVTALIASGGSLLIDNVLAGEANGSSVTFSTGGGSLVIGGPTGAVSAGILVSGLTSNTDIVDAAGLSYSGITGYSISAVSGGAQLITISDSAGSFSFMSAGTSFTAQTYTLAGGPLRLSADSSGGTDISVCFLAGTRIAVPDGETPVEELRVGDLVATRPGARQAKQIVFKPVTWIGYRAVDVADYADALQASPVRIRADAFSSDAPHRDLLVTPDHCILVEGKLTPARMLVNGRSIIADTSIRRYQYFHIELAEHSILIAEGLETESYLDTGNRGNFANAMPALLRADYRLDPAHKAWSEHAAAPLAVDRLTVEPIWRRLAERADLLSFPRGGAVAANLQSLVTDPDLRVVTQSGFTARPVAHRGCTYSFAVPPGTRSLRLESRAARPADTIGPFIDDRRQLGVKVGRIDLGVGPRQERTVAHLRTSRLDGWHDVEPEQEARWTNGSAELPLDLARHTARWTFIEIEVFHAGPYPALASAFSDASDAKAA